MWSYSMNTERGSKAIRSNRVERETGAIDTDADDAQVERNAKQDVGDRVREGGS